MNKRIRELAIEAKLIVPEYNGFDLTKLSVSHKIFAMLIVRECAKFLDENSGSDQCNNVWCPTPEELLQHFGVEL